MKKMLFIIACLVLLVGCGDSKPDGMSDDNYKLSKNALETHNDYLGGDLSGDEASEKLYAIADLFEDDESHNSEMIRITCESSAYELLKASCDNDTIRDNRDEIENFIK